MEKGEIRIFKTLIVGGSAGSLSVVLMLLPFLTKPDICVILVLHRKQSDDGVLVEILSRKTILKVKEADEKDSLTPGILYIAPADYHLLVEKDLTITLDDSEKVHYSRPSIDVTFESAAEALKANAVFLLLSGANADGVAGLIKAKRLGSRIVIQDPAFAEVPFMPQQALDSVKADFVMKEKNIRELLTVLSA